MRIKILVNIINVISDLKTSNNTVTSVDNIPPVVPNIHPYDEFVSTQIVSIKGNTEPSATVQLYLNGEKNEVVAGQDSEFIFRLDLSEGENEFYVISVDAAGNKSNSSKVYRITYDKSPPNINITSPQDNASYSGTSAKMMEIKGSTEADSTVTINDKFVSVDESGAFISRYSLNNGENKITIKSIDRSGNENSKDLTITYQE